MTSLHCSLRPITFAALIGLAASAAMPAFAQADASRAARAQQAMAQLEQRFKAADANGDGLLTKDEAKGKMPRVYERFDTIDVEKKGSLTLDQIKQFGAQALAQRKGAQ